jgi:hypothetical protein
MRFPGVEGHGTCAGVEQLKESAAFCLGWALASGWRVGSAWSLHFLFCKASLPATSMQVTKTQCCLITPALDDPGSRGMRTRDPPPTPRSEEITPVGITQKKMGPFLIGCSHL